MSLLMDALRRAESSKQEAARAAASAEQPPPGLTLEPIGAETSQAANSLPDLALHIDALAADLAATSNTQNLGGAPASETTGPAQTASNFHQTASEEALQAAARNLFAAKHVAPPSRKPLWIGLGALGFALLGIGGYVWYQTQALSVNTLSRVPPAPVAAARPAPPPLPLNPSATPRPAPAETPLNLPQNPASTVTNAFPEAFPGRPAFPAAERATLPAEPRIANSNIRFSRSRLEVDPHLQTGYAKLQANQLDAARRDYDAALRADPNNIDALLALAAIAQRQGQSADAERYLQRALDADPRDPAVLAAAMGNAPGSDPTPSESRLKTLLAAQPESGPLNFALGNLYARQGRWPEAQQFYFNAVAADSDNPDYLFNLAVSLDQIRQAKLAAQHYRLALEAAQKRPAAFDRESVRLRLNELQP